jgi:type I restriction enzyme S subunit
MALSPYWWEQIAKFNNVGAVFDSLKCADVPNFELPVPPHDTQKLIADLLGALDDKIEVNRRMNETLEAMARAIFRDWFVDFGPTRAKMEGRAPYLAPDIWSLFPDRLDDEGKPDGWINSTIGQEVDVVGGSTPSTKETTFWGGDIAWATPKDLSSLSTPVLLGTERQITDAGLSQIGSGLLPVGTVLLSSRAPIGYMAIAQLPVAVNQGFIAMVCRKRLSNVFVWLWTQANMETVHQNANGSTFQEISKANFRPIKVTIATPKTHRVFDEAVVPLFERIVANERESRTLAATRDLLLPKLMSGEVRVSEASAAVEHRLAEAR